MPKFTLSRSESVSESVGEVFACVRDFRTWPSWSPWLVAEPKAEVVYAPDGNAYSWDGAIVGSGEIVLSSENPPDTLQYRLTLLKPWKSQSSVSFRFEPTEVGTRVTWTMDGYVPFFLYWMKKMMVAYIGMDYKRGLTMLKDICEKGSIGSELRFRGGEAFAGFKYLGIRNAASLDGMGDAMMSDIEKLRSWFESSGTQSCGKPFSIYHKFDMVKGHAEYTIGFPIQGELQHPPSGFVVDEMPSHSAYAVGHLGPYRHLGNAWTAGMMRARNKVFKQSRKIHPFEVYENDPTETPEEELETSIYFPMA